MKLIILNITAYREKDAVVNGISEEGFVTFRVPGLLSAKSKFAYLNNSLSIIEPIFSESKTTKHLTLKEASLLFSPMQGAMDFHYVTAITILLQAINKLVEDADKVLLYQDLFNALLALKNKVNPYIVTLKFLIALVNKTGYELSVNGCVRCGSKKNIVAYSFLEGGFICKEHFTSDDHSDLDLNEMPYFRNVFLHNGYAFEEEFVKEKIAISLLKKINIFISDAYGYCFKEIINL
ncbi:MAG: DNA repair protein RecO [Bacilli bacterium]|nr:DNA repair protein RecO [Bacilli bacterium]